MGFICESKSIVKPIHSFAGSNSGAISNGDKINRKKRSAFERCVYRLKKLVKKI